MRASRLHYSKTVDIDNSRFLFCSGGRRHGTARLVPCALHADVVRGNGMQTFYFRTSARNHNPTN